MGFGTADNNTIRTTFYNMKIEVRVCLGMRSQGTVPFRVCHCSVYRQVVILHVFNEFLEVVMVVSTILFIYFISCAESRIESIHTNTALETGCPSSDRRVFAF